MAIVTLTEKLSNIEKTEPTTDNTRLMESDLEVKYDEQVEISKLISGYEWTVNYYNAQGDLSDYQDNFDSTLDFGIIDYVEYKNLVLYLDSPLEMVKPEELQGEALLDLNIIPKPSDVFIAKLIDGRYGIFTLTSIKRGVYNLSNVFKIGFKIYQIVDSLKDPIIEKIKNSTYTELYYNKDYIKDSSIPVLSKTQKDDIEYFNSVLKDLVKQYSRLFITPENYFIPLFKDDVYRYYDPNIIKFMLRFIPITELNNKMEIFNLPTEITILDYIADDSIFLSEVNKYLKFIENVSDYPNPYLMEVRFSPIGRIITAGEDYDKDLEFKNPGIGDNLFPKISNKFYVFGEDFYSVLYKEKNIEEVNLTVFETLILNLINREPLDKEQLYDVLDNLSGLNKMQQYYFLPLSYVLVRYYLTKLKTTTK